MNQCGMRLIHPGTLLLEEIEEGLGLTISDAAGQMGISYDALLAVVEGRAPITPALAASIGSFIGNGPGLWLRMQADYDGVAA